MADISVAKSTGPDSINESVFLKYELKVSYVDLINGGTYADDDTATLELPAKAGQVVTGVGVQVVESFDDSGAGATLTLDVGDGSDLDGFIDAAEIHADGTPVTYAYNTGDLVDGTTSDQKVFVTDGDVNLTFTPTSYNLGELTQGEVIVTVYSVTI
jgi:hypothetical protein